MSDKERLEVIARIANKIIDDLRSGDLPAFDTGAIANAFDVISKVAVMPDEFLENNVARIDELLE